jgi:protein ImuB
MRRVLCLHLPQLATQRVRRAAPPADSRRPIVLTRVVGASQQVVEACPLAQARGVQADMTLGQAQAAAPDLRAVPADPPADEKLLRRMAAWAIRFSPLVQPAPPECLLLEVSGCERLFGGEEPLTRRAAAGLASRGFRVQAAVADTIGAAWALATAGSAPLTFVPPGHVSAALTPLPPAALRIDPRVADQLDALGIRSLGDLFMLPRSSLRTRFGPQLVWRVQQALGELPESLETYLPPEVPCARQRYDEPLNSPQAVAAQVRSLLDELFAQLAQRRRALRRLELVITFEEAAPQIVALGLARASREVTHVWQLLQERLTQIDVSPGVSALLLIVREDASRRPQQEDLFEPRDPSADERLGELADRLASRLGYGAILRPQLIDDHQPEHAVRLVSIGEVGCEAQHATDDTSAAPLPAQPRPPQLFERPVPIRVMALVPDGPPTWLLYNSTEHTITHAAGPERLETAWWRGADVRRDYFRVTLDSGEQLWIFRDLSSRQWFVHGVFS